MPYRIKRIGKGAKVVSPNHPQGFSEKVQTVAKANAQRRAIEANAPPEKEKPKKPKS